ncbi:MAG TPA: metalloregulator ArsR/SmtB family transcription factor [Puia sp.]|nr:metalloregulator ArsR/SmtB family transcription factor [Puia sp.]
MQARRDVFQAIADPTRRSMIGLLAGRTLTLNAVAGNFRISQPAVSKHIRILAECGLVVITRQGRERHCTASLQPLDDVVHWAEQYRAFWKDRFDRLEQLIAASSPDAHSPGTPGGARPDAKTPSRKPKTVRPNPKSSKYRLKK